MDGYTTKTQGLDKLRRRLRAIKRSPMLGAVVDTKPTTGRLRRAKGADETERRSAAENIEIARRHAKQKTRSIMALDKATYSAISKHWRRGVRRFTKAGNADHLQAAAREVSKALVRAIRKRVESGKLKAVKPATQRRKDREGLRPGLPAMIRSGQLLKSLIDRVRRF